MLYTPAIGLSAYFTYLTMVTCITCLTLDIEY
jgi:hypothetical protein